MERSVTAPRRALPLVAVIIVALAVVLVGAVVLALPRLQTLAQTSSAASSEQDLAVARAYFAAFNAGMKSGDFSGLPAVMAPDVVETMSNPQGQTGIHRGLNDVTAFYQGFQKNFAGYQWTTDDMRALGPGVVIAFEHAGLASTTAPGRCVHVFKIENGKITSYDWATFYPGIK
jgi:ketosteroid isomerase-like protein